MTNTTTLQETLIALSKEAGKAILEIYHDESAFDRVDFKADDSPLTLADQAAHNVIVAGLEKATPEIPILSEEGKHLPFEERQHWSKLWVVDPLDGTKEFIKRNGEFTVNIALVENGAVVMGFVYVPVQDVTYYAIKGEGAFVKRGDAAAEKIEVAKFDMADEGLRLVCSRSHMSPEVEAYVEKFISPELVSMGSSLKLVMVAEGKADIYPRLAPTMEWDTAAAQIVVEEAGGTVINHETGTAVVYNKPNLLNPHFIVFGAH